MLGYLLARAGIDVTVLEKHADFLRDFRGDTIHPSTLEVMHQLGLLDELLTLPHQRAESLHAEVAGRDIKLADFTRLPTRCKFIAFMPQWEFLNFWRSRPPRSPFQAAYLNAGSSATQRPRPGMRRAGRHAGRPDPRAQPAGDRHRRPQLGGARAGGAQQPLLRCPARRIVDEAQQAAGRSGLVDGPHRAETELHHDRSRRLLAVRLLDRQRQLRCDPPQRAGEILLHLAEVAPFQDDHLQKIVEWDQVKLLSIRIDRLDRWAKPGVLCIGDAAHAMSPIGGVGVNLAIQDAVAAANALIPPLRQHRLQLKHLLSVQRRREFPTRAIQFLQIKMSQRKPGERRAAGGSRLIARVGNSRWLPRLFGRIIGLGFRRETPRHLSNETCPLE